jgi:hypothetical protein
VNKLEEAIEFGHSLRHRLIALLFELIFCAATLKVVNPLRRLSRPDLPPRPVIHAEVILRYG